MFWITTLILVFAMYGSAQASVDDWRQKDVCPKILKIPACYIVFASFLIAGLGHFSGSPTGNLLFYGFIGIPAVIALAGSVIELAGKEICPRTGQGIPMCFISLGICVMLLASKFFTRVA